MPVIRSLMPTDLVALANFYGRAFPNQAQPRPSLEKGPEGPLNVGALLEQWLTAENRKALVAVEGLTSIHGLLTARQRDGKSVWEIDRLMLEEDSALSTALLEDLADRVSRSGARRIFLRLPLESTLVAGARRAGFFPYLTETLYQGAAIHEPESSPEFQAPTWGRAKADSYELFRLYCTSVPAAVQMTEGASLEEWTDAQGPSFGRRRDYLWRKGGELSAWLRMTQHDHCHYIELLIHPSEEAAIRYFIQYAMRQLPKGAKVLALVPDYQSGFRRALTQDWSFEEVAHYAALVRQLAVRVPAGQLVPART